MVYFSETLHYTYIYLLNDVLNRSAQGHKNSITQRFIIDLDQPINSCRLRAVSKA